VSGVGRKACLSACDSGQAPPPGRDADDEDEHGRGLVIVSALSADRGWSRGDVTGKYVWSVIHDGTPRG
jgi:hypothetical protein